MPGSTSSFLVAQRIKKAVLDAMQEAEEIGGPDYPEYIVMMDELAAECRARAENAERAQRERVVAYLNTRLKRTDVAIEHTGGGCTAILIQCDGASRGDASHWLVTAADDAMAPEDPDKPMALGLYPEETSLWVQFNARNAAHAADIIEAFDSSCFGEA